MRCIPQHIAEENDQKMDEMEARMSQDDRQVHQSLDQLSTMPSLAGNSDVKAAAAAYVKFNDLRVQILRLSRENTNVRAFSISLNQKCKALLLCQASLSMLHDAIAVEPGGGIRYETRPR